MSSAFNIPAGWREVLARAKEGLGAGGRNHGDQAFIDYGAALIDHIEEGIEALAAPTPPVDAVPGEPAVPKYRIGAPPRDNPLPEGWLDDYITSGETKLNRYEMPGVYFVQGVRFAEAHYASRLAASVAPRAGSEPVASEGLPLAQEPKYTVNGSAIVNRASGEAIPADEPVFIFRARDKHAVSALRQYLYLVRGTHSAAVAQRIRDFNDFYSAHPERMKEPDTASAGEAQATGAQPHTEPSEEASSLPVVAHLVEKGRIFVDRPVLEEDEAERAAFKRQDGAIVSPLVRLSDAQSQLNAMRVERDKWYQEAAAQAASAIAAHEELAALKAAPVVDVERSMALAEKMMRDSWATGDDSAWHPARDELRAALASPEGSQT